jgi:two-component system, OmpR family, sensor kinase
MLAFAYVLVVVIVTLEVPLAINLQRRVRAETESRAMVTALTVAAAVGAENLARTQAPNADLATTSLQKWIYANFSHTEDGRIVVVDTSGTLVADSMGTGSLGDPFATSSRPELDRVLSTHRPYSAFRYSDTLHEEILVAAAPIIDERFVGVVRYTKGVGEVQSGIRRAIFGAVAIGFAALLAGLIVAFALADSLSRPLRRLASAAHRLGEGDLAARVERAEGATEITELGRSFDDMADRLEATVKAQREFVANASHQLRTPLTGMKLRLESAIDAAGDAEVRRQLEAADQEVDRLAGIVERLLVMSRRIEQGAVGEVDVDAAIARAADRWHERAARAGSSLSASGHAGSAVGDSNDLDQILDNLIDNAIAYAPGAVRLTRSSEDGRVVVVVEDDGPGIAPEEAARVAERFYRGRGSGPGGSGLGLAIVRELAERGGGSMDVGRSSTGGARIEVRLPASAGNGDGERTPSPPTVTGS